MAIKHNYEIIEGLTTDVYLKINDYKINSQIEKKDEKDEGVKSYICNCNVVLMDLKQTKSITSFNEIFKIDDINTFTLEKAYKKINEKYKGDKI